MEHRNPNLRILTNIIPGGRYRLAARHGSSCCLHKLGGLKTAWLIFLQVWAKWSKMYYPKIKSRFLQSLVPPGGSKKQWIPLPLPASGSHLPSLTLGPFFNFQSIWLQNLLWSLSPSPQSPPSEDFLRAVLATSRYLLHLKIFTFITSAKPPFATEGKIQVWEIDRDILGRSLCNKM